MGFAAKIPLIHRNIEAWLADTENQTIPHGEVVLDGNTMSTTVPLDYAVHWRSHPGTTHTVFCEIFVHGKKTRVATHFMDKDKPETQTRSSLGRISPVVMKSKNNNWLTMKAPTASKKAPSHVELHIWQAKDTPIHECRPDPRDLGGHLDEIDIDLIDDANGGKDPFIIFRFEFVLAPQPKPPNVPSPQKRKQSTEDSTHLPSNSRGSQRVIPSPFKRTRLDDPVGQPAGTSDQDNTLALDDVERLNASTKKEAKLDADLEDLDNQIETLSAEIKAKYQQMAAAVRVQAVPRMRVEDILQKHRELAVRISLALDPDFYTDAKTVQSLQNELNTLKERTEREEGLLKRHGVSDEVRVGLSVMIEQLQARRAEVDPEYEFPSTLLASAQRAPPARPSAQAGPSGTDRVQGSGRLLSDAERSGSPDGGLERASGPQRAPSSIRGARNEANASPSSLRTRLSLPNDCQTFDVVFLPFKSDVSVSLVRIVTYT
ncbi:hypothetical protein MSAN_01256000 [Mycena sanguinolenta]|uniref:Uncharacterized protein n=1 Tax=Mycena sanguinolenta TaxID=230812 RepID=A0A8H6YHM3_9AGAR|nr:hypothetical protein MSAN_01256000 [Mycena sanguinolenta]